MSTSNNSDEPLGPTPAEVGFVATSHILMHRTDQLIESDKEPPQSLQFTMDVDPYKSFYSAYAACPPMVLLEVSEFDEKEFLREAIDEYEEDDYGNNEHTKSIRNVNETYITMDNDPVACNMAAINDTLLDIIERSTVTNGGVELAAAMTNRADVQKYIDSDDEEENTS